IASGAPLGFAQSEIELLGHAMECRVNAEHPETFLPSPGIITSYHPPGGLGVRVDSAIYQGYAVPPHYDSLMRMRRALEEFVIAGIETTIPMHQKLLRNPDIINGDYDTHWLERLLG